MSGLGWWPVSSSAPLPQPLATVVLSFWCLLPSPIYIWMMSGLGWWLVTLGAPLPSPNAVVLPFCLLLCIYGWWVALGDGWWSWLPLPQPLLLSRCPFDALLSCICTYRWWVAFDGGWWPSLPLRQPFPQPQIIYTFIYTEPKDIYMYFESLGLCWWLMTLISPHPSPSCCWACPFCLLRTFSYANMDDELLI